MGIPADGDPSAATARAQETWEPVRNITEFEPPTPIFVGPAGGGTGGLQMYTEREWRVSP